MKRIISNFRRLSAVVLAMILVSGLIPAEGLYKNVYALSLDVGQPEQYDIMAASAPSDGGYVKPDSAPDYLIVVPVTDTGTPAVPTEGMDFRFRFADVPEGYVVDNEASLVRGADFDPDKPGSPLGNDDNGVYTLPAASIHGPIRVEVKYKAKNPGPGPEPQPDPATAVAPIQNAENGGIWNLFYTTYYGQDYMKINLPEGADPERSNGQWKKYYNITKDGKVTVTAQGSQRGIAAGDSYTTINIPIYNDQNVKIGEFKYKLPVVYQKPELKLSSNKADMRAGMGPQTFSTTVLMESASDIDVPLDLSRQRKDVTIFTNQRKNPEVTIPEDGKKGEILFTAEEETVQGKLHIQLDDWSKEITLPYNIRATKKDFFTYSINGGGFKKDDSCTVYVDSRSAPGTKDIVIKIRLNGKEPVAGTDSELEMVWPGESPKYPIKYSAEFSGDTMTIKYPDDPSIMIHRKNIFVIRKKSDPDVKFSVKVNGAGKELDKIMDLKVVTSLDLTTGQNLIMTPVLKQVTGNIEEVTVSDDRFVPSYNAELNQVIVSANPLKPPKKGPTSRIIFYVKVAGLTCPITKHLSVNTSHPRVNGPKSIYLPLSKIKDGTAEGASGMKITRTYHFKTYTVNPVSVSFTKGVRDEAAIALGEGWYRIKRSYVFAKYDPDSRMVLVKTEAKKNPGLVRVNMMLNYNYGVSYKRGFDVIPDRKA